MSKEINRDEQFEELTRVICQSNRDGICGYDRKPCHFDCGSYQLATKVYNAGYRRASDVAEELINVLELKLLSEYKEDLKLYEASARGAFFKGTLTAYQKAIDWLAELKKKYTEEEK